MKPLVKPSQEACQTGRTEQTQRLGAEKSEGAWQDREERSLFAIPESRTRRNQRLARLDLTKPRIYFSPKTRKRCAVHRSAPHEKRKNKVQLQHASARTLAALVQEQEVRNG